MTNQSPDARTLTELQESANSAFDRLVHKINAVFPTGLNVHARQGAGYMTATISQPTNNTRLHLVSSRTGQAHTKDYRQVYTSLDMLLRSGSHQPCNHFHSGDQHDA